MSDTEKAPHNAVEELVEIQAAFSAIGDEIDAKDYAVVDAWLRYIAVEYPIMHRLADAMAQSHAESGR